MLQQEAIDKALNFFDEGYACSQAVLLTFSAQYNVNEETAKLLSSTFGGGMGRLREKCGALTGAFMVLGLAYGNTQPKDMETKLNAYKKVRELNQTIENIHGTTTCADLLKKHVTIKDVEERKHHRLICRRVIEDVVRELYLVLETNQSKIKP
jgi:C_GCAxxG_C_C family probable redox protein